MSASPLGEASLHVLLLDLKRTELALSEASLSTGAALGYTLVGGASAALLCAAAGLVPKAAQFWRRAEDNGEGKETQPLIAKSNQERPECESGK